MDRRLTDGILQKKVAVALVWPLRAAIASSFEHNHTLRISELLAGLPAWISTDFNTYERVVATRVS
jgi:hypothetical protein